MLRFADANLRKGLNFPFPPSDLQGQRKQSKKITENPGSVRISSSSIRLFLLIII